MVRVPSELSRVLFPSCVSAPAKRRGGASAIATGRGERRGEVIREEVIREEVIREEGWEERRGCKRRGEKRREEKRQ